MLADPEGNEFASCTAGRRRARVIEEARAVRRTERSCSGRQGRTFAGEAGNESTDEPSPLYQLLVLITMLSVHITATVAVIAAR